MAKNPNAYGWRGYLSDAEADLLVDLLEESEAIVASELPKATHIEDQHPQAELLLRHRNLIKKLRTRNQA